MGRRKKSGRDRGGREKSGRVAADGAGFGGSLGDLLRAQGLASGASDPAPGAAAPTGPAPAVPTADDLSGLGKIVVRRTRKGRGGRTVTLIEGIDALSDSERKALAAAARKAMGAGSRVEDLTVVVQGDLGPRLAVWLEARGARRVIVS